MDYNIPVTRRIRELVAGGVISIGVHITGDGIDSWARVNQPHPRLGVQTHTSYTLDEIEHLLVKVVTRPLHSSVIGASPYSGKTPAQTIIGGVGAATRSGVVAEPIPSDLGFSSRDQAILHSKMNGLGEKWKRGIKNELPADSLTPTDFDRSVKDLYARACAVAETLTSPKLVSRISSKPDKLAVKGCESLHEWWSRAEPAQRLMLLTSHRHFASGEGRVRIHGNWLDKIQLVPCPFRDPETQMVIKREEISGDSLESSDDDFPMSGQGGSYAAW